MIVLCRHREILQMQCRTMGKEGDNAQSNCAFVLRTRSRFGLFGDKRFKTERENARAARAFLEGSRVVI